MVFGNSLIQPRSYRLLLLSLLAVTIMLVGGHLMSRTFVHAADSRTSNSRLITLYDRGDERSFITTATTLRDAFRQADISISPDDRVEPTLDETLAAASYQVNIYRARPVTVIDGATKLKIMTAYQTPKQIASHSGIELRNEDATTMNISSDLISSGAGLELSIDRALPVQLKLYGKDSLVYTQAITVDEFLKEKAIKLGKDDTVSLPRDARITPSIVIEIWRDGVQTVTNEEQIEPPVETVMDMNQPVGYQSITNQGRPGMRSIVYEIVIDNGRELSRKEIQNVVTKQPEKRVMVIGAKTSNNPLTKSKGAQQFTDSKGVTHRETYYDLPMNAVMQACGAGGVYSVRSADGAKVDKDGYVIIAANLGNYPRCSVVETSMGLGKVYDTGGFAARHPHGFDLATDWTNNNGR